MTQRIRIGDNAGESVGPLDLRSSLSLILGLSANVVPGSTDVFSVTNSASPEDDTIAPILTTLRGGALTPQQPVSPVLELVVPPTIGYITVTRLFAGTSAVDILVDATASTAAVISGSLVAPDGVGPGEWVDVSGAGPGFVCMTSAIAGTAADFDIETTVETAGDVGSVLVSGLNSGNPQASLPTPLAALRIVRKTLGTSGEIEAFFVALAQGVPSGGSGGQVPGANTQAVWYTNFSAGNDTANGKAATLQPNGDGPLQTVQEVWTRIGNQPIAPGFAVTVNNDGDQTGQQFAPLIVGPQGTITVNGTRVAGTSTTISVAVQWAGIGGGDGTYGKYTWTAIPVGLAPFYSAPSGYSFHIDQDNGGGVYNGTWYQKSGDTLPTPPTTTVVTAYGVSIFGDGAGDVLCVYNVTGGGSLIFNDVRFANGPGDVQFQVTGSVQFYGCRFDCQLLAANASVGLYGSVAELGVLMTGGSDLYLRASTCKGLNLSPFSTVHADGNVAFYGGLPVNGYLKTTGIAASINYSSAEGGTGIGVEVTPTGKLYNKSTFFLQSDHATGMTVGIQIDGLGTWISDSSADVPHVNATNPPTVDWKIGGVSHTQAAVVTAGNIIAPNGAAFVTQ